MARARVHFVKKARKAIPGLVKKGQSYWWWKFRYSGKYISTTDPGVTVMVRLTEYEENTKRFQEYESLDDVEELESLKEEAEEFKQELEDRLSNMPEQLQESHVLNERVEELDEIINSIDIRIEELT